MKWLLISLSLLPGGMAMVAAQSTPPAAQSSISDSWLAFASLAMMILGPASLWFMRKIGADLTAAKASIPEKVDPLIAKIGVLERRLSSLESDLGKRTKERDEAILQTDSYRQENRILRDDLTKDRLAREELTRRTNEQEKLITDLTKESSKQQAEISTLRQQIESYKDVNTLGRIVIEGMSDMRMAFKELLELVKHSTSEQRVVPPEMKPAT